MLPDLASLSDIQFRLLTPLTPEQERTAQAFLTDASAAVRLYTGQVFTRVVDDDVVLRVKYGKVRLPQRPVIAVSSVLTTAFDMTRSPTFFYWDRLQTVRLNPNVLNYFSWEPFRFDVDTVTVTYTHGYADGELPEALTGLVAQIVGRALGVPLIQSGIVQESIASYSYSVGSAASAGGFGLLPAEKDALDKFTRTVGMVSLGMS